MLLDVITTRETTHGAWQLVYVLLARETSLRARPRVFHLSIYSSDALSRRHQDRLGTVAPPSRHHQGPEMPVREAALRPLYKKIDALITDKVKDFFEMADGYSDVVVENGNTPYSCHTTTSTAL